MLTRALLASAIVCALVARSRQALVPSTAIVLGASSDYAAFLGGALDGADASDVGAAVELSAASGWFVLDLGATMDVEKIRYGCGSGALGARAH